MTDTKKTILIVEDETALLQAITTKMEKSGFKTVGCTTAEQALDYLKNLTEVPDAIWLDYYLGGSMNGVEFLERVKQNEKWSNISVLVVSNTATEGNIDRMVSLGIEKYFVKAENKLGDMIGHMNDLIKD